MSTRAGRKGKVKSGRAWGKPSVAGPWDVIVIGSGMGGMTAAALLSKVGKRVLVIEQHYTPGGFTHTFRRPGGFSWDVGVHAVGEVTPKSMTGRLLERLTDGGLAWASLGDVYDEFHYPGDFRIDFPDNPSQFRDNLVAAFPSERVAIDDYLARVRSVSAAMRPYYLARALPHQLAPLADRTLARHAQRAFEERTAPTIREVTRDARLATVLTSQWGYYGSVPSRSSFAMQALVTKHFLWGGYYPVGGSQRIAEELLGTVARAGGWTRIATSVERILVRDGKAHGVRLEDGEEITAPAVISAVGVSQTLRRLLPDVVASRDWAREVKALPPAPAHVCLYLGFEGDIRSAGAGAANKWFYEVWDSEADAWQVSPDSDSVPDAPVLYCSFPSLKDPTHEAGDPPKHTGEVVTFVPWSAFDQWRDTRWKRRGDDYDAFKARLTEKLQAQLLRHMPALGPMIRHAELSTPLSTDTFCRPLRGSIYGLEPTPERFRCRWLRPRSPVPNLYFAGSEVATVGVIGAMMGGVLAALAADPVGALRYLRQVA